MALQLRRILTMAAAVAIGSFGLMTPAVAGPASPDDPDVIVAGPMGEQKAWFPDIVRLQDGRLVTIYYQATQHSRDDGRYLWTESTDAGRTWSEPRVVIDTPEDDRDAQITQLADGTILINWFRTDWTNESTTGAVILGTYVTSSTDGGSSWSEPEQVGSRMSCGCGDIHGAYRLGWAATTGKIVELANGDLLLPLYGTLPDTTVGQASVARSIDRGRTWPVENEAMIPVPEGVSLSEMALARTADSSATALLRTAGNSSGGFSYQTDTADGGRSWSLPTKTSMKGQAHHILELPGGMLLATYGDRSGQFASNEPVAGRLRMKNGNWDSHRSVLMYRAGANVDQADPSTADLGNGRYFTVSYDQVRGSVIGTYSELGDFVRVRNWPGDRDPAATRKPPASSILDLPALHTDGDVSYLTDLTSTHRDHPTAQPGGAIDGVARYWYSSLGPVATPQEPRQFTLTFAEPTKISWIGLNLKPGYAETVAVYVSTDGENWGDPVDVRQQQVAAEDVISWARIDTVPTATAVKVVITQSAGASMLAELMIAR